MISNIILHLPFAETPSYRQPVWQPIVSAPMIGTPVLIYCPAMPQHDQQFMASWQSSLGADGSLMIQQEWREIATGLPGLDNPHCPAHCATLPSRSFELNISEFRLLGWLPIELAPGDDTPTLIYDPSLPSPHRMFAALWENTGGGSRAEEVEWCEIATGLDDIDSPFRPTHFRCRSPAPLPKWHDDMPQ